MKNKSNNNILKIESFFEGGVFTYLFKFDCETGNIFSVNQAGIRTWNLYLSKSPDKCFHCSIILRCYLSMSNMK